MGVPAFAYFPHSTLKQSLKLHPVTPSYVLCDAHVSLHYSSIGMSHILLDYFLIKLFLELEFTQKKKLELKYRTHNKSFHCIRPCLADFSLPVRSRA